MGTKNIAISEEAYERLAALKGPNESFTDVVNRITGKRSITELAGILTHDEAEAVRNTIAEMRASSASRVESLAERLGDHAR